MCAEASASPARPVLVPVADVCVALLELFAQVSDGRSDQGRDHPVAAALALATAATGAGMGGYTAIHGWVADVPAQILCDLYTRTGGNTRVGPPSKPTIWWVLTSTDPEAFEAAVGAWLTRGLSAVVEAAGHTSAGDSTDRPVLMQVRSDGKTLRGAVDADGDQMHLLAALVGRPRRVTDRLAGDADYKVRAAVARALGYNGLAVVGSHLAELLNDPNWHVRACVLESTCIRQLTAPESARHNHRGRDDVR